MPNPAPTAAARIGTPAGATGISTSAITPAATAVTMDDVNAAARSVQNPDRATVVIAGPYADN